MDRKSTEQFVPAPRVTSDKMAQVNDPTVYIIHCANDVRRFMIVVSDAQLMTLNTVVLSS